MLACALARMFQSNGMQSSEQAEHYQRATLGGAKGIGGLSMTLGPADAEWRAPLCIVAARTSTSHGVCEQYKAELLKHIGCGRISATAREDLARSVVRHCLH
jgi:hypothetical protein